MAKVKLGDLAADMGPRPSGTGRHYVRIGTVFQDEDRISIKIDSLPLGQWSGWANVFPTRESKSEHPSYNELARRHSSGEDDIPF